VDVADEPGALADVDLVHRLHLAFDGAQHFQLPRENGGLDFAGRGDSETMFHHLDGSFHLALNDQIFPALDLSFENDALPENRLRGGRLNCK